MTTAPQRHSYLREGAAAGGSPGRRAISRLGLDRLAKLGVPWLGILVLAFILPANGVTSAFLSGALATAFGGIKDAIILGLFAFVVVTGRIRRVPVPVVVLVVMITALGAVSAVWTPNLEQAAYGWRNDFLPLLALVVVPAIIERRHLAIVTTAFVVALQLASATTIVTWNQGLDWLFTLGVFPLAPDALFPSSLFVAGSIEPRAFSPYSAPNENAVATTIALALLWTRPGWPILLKCVLTAMPLVAIALTQSRSGYIGLAILAVTLVAWALFRRRPMLVWAMFTIAGVAAVAGVTLYLYIDKVISHVADPSLIGHSDSLFENLPFLISHPFGLGLGKVGPRAQLYSTDSVLVESFFLVLAIESGLLVMALFAALVAYLFVHGIRAGTLDGLLPTAAIAGALVSFTVLPTLQEGPVAYTLWIVCGIGLVAGRPSSGIRPVRRKH
ncbi:O-antigen ligase family protein [Microbacteriaceae bacterium VKM Ac-2855]|nr:O-antigen ligase family protein [Microbacteriaceae bacterium VKM Ac-2855]